MEPIDAVKRGKAEAPQAAARTEAPKPQMPAQKTAEKPPKAEAPKDDAKIKEFHPEPQTMERSQSTRNIIEGLLDIWRAGETHSGARITQLEEQMLRESLKQGNLEAVLRYAPATIWSIIKKVLKDRKRVNEDMENLVMASLMNICQGDFEHSVKVADLAAALAEEINLTKEEIERVRWGALFRDIGKTGLILAGLAEEERESIVAFMNSEPILTQEGAGLHDIGKIKVPTYILEKTSALTQEELEILKQHPLIGEAMLKPIPRFASILPAVRNHHERWDGMGYPDGLFSDHIPTMARIIHITDSFDAMISDRPYRAGLGVQDALLELKKNAGSQFDPALVKAFIPIIIQQYKIEFSRKEEVAEQLMKDSKPDLTTAIESGMMKFAEQFWGYVDRITKFFTQPPEPRLPPYPYYGEETEAEESVNEEDGAPPPPPPPPAPSGFPQYPGTLPPPPDL